MKPEALLIIDIQHGFICNGVEEILPSLVELVQKWPCEDLYYLKYKNYPGSSFTRYLDWHEFMTSEQASIVPEVYVEGSAVYNHYGYAPPEDLMVELNNKYENIGICGVDTDACVMAAVFALWDAEIRPFVLAEYCASSGGSQFHRAALDLMLRQFGTGSVIQGIDILKYPDQQRAKKISTKS